MRLFNYTERYKIDLLPLKSGIWRRSRFNIGNALKTRLNCTQFSSAGDIQGFFDGGK